MSHFKTNLMHLILISFFSIAHADSVFRWIDASGHVHYSDRPPQESVKHIQEKHITQSMIQTSGDSYAMQIASRKFPATFYTSGDCGDICAKAKAFLDQRGVPYTTVDTNSQASLLIKVTGNTKVPVLTLGPTTVLRGWEENRWATALEEAGYPKHFVRSKSVDNSASSLQSNPASSSSNVAIPQSTDTPKALHN